MAYFSRKTVILILIVICALGVVLRYPLVEHERYQTDSYFIHLLSQSVVDKGYAVWTLHPLSYFGYYPYSYPSGAPMVLGEMSILTGLNTETCPLIMGMIIGIAFTLVAFCLARVFLRKTEYVLLCALLVTVGPRFIDTSYWNASARAPFVVLFTTAVLALFLASSVKRPNLRGVAALLMVGSLSIHHMAVLFVLFGVAYVIAVIPITYMLPRFTRRRSVITFTYSISAFVAVLILGFGFLDYFRIMAEMNLRSPLIPELDPPVVTLILTAAAGYTKQMGVVVPLALLAIPILLRRRALTVDRLFPFALMLVFVPFVGNLIYMSVLLLPFVAVLAIVLIAWLHDKTRKKSLFVALVIVLIVGSILLPIWSIAGWNTVEQRSGDTVEVPNQVFNDASYLRCQMGGIIALSNTNVLSTKLSATSGIPFIDRGIPLILSDILTPADVAERVVFSDAPFPANLLVWFEYESEPRADVYVLILMVRGVEHVSEFGSASSEIRTFFAEHNRLLVAIDNRLPDDYVYMYGEYQSVFTSELRSSCLESSGFQQPNYPFFSSYCTYESEGTTLYAIHMSSDGAT